ncbi:MAG: BrnA antitoxin family protein [Chloroflexi bacterium]|nr:BrnA antitoxin family protein [Chloroflexota bacterium]MBU1746741.1 BrnA antitoxin family protein [Chloroflexota bacterium]
MDDDARISTRLPRELYERAKTKAQREDITLSQVIRRCLRDWVDNDPPPDPPEEEQSPQTD